MLGAEDPLPEADQTIEILMSDLDPEVIKNISTRNRQTILFFKASMSSVTGSMDKKVHICNSTDNFYR